MEREHALDSVKMAATSPDMEAAGGAGSQGAQWGQRPLVPGASGDAESPGAIKERRERQEPEERELEELLDYESEPSPEHGEHSLQFCSEPRKPPGTLNHSEGEPVDPAIEDQLLEAIKAQVRETTTTEEVDKVKELQKELAQQMKMHSPPGNHAQVVLYPEEKKEADVRSIYIGNVDYGATAEELEAHFRGCGSINRVTILSDKFTGHPKGFAYIEFSDEESAKTSLSLDESLFRGRQIKVTPKRTNRPGISTTNRGFPRARYGGRTTNPRSGSQSYARFHRRPWGPVYWKRPVHRGRPRATLRYSPY